MPTIAAFSFLAARAHTTPWGSHVNEGVVEWPPAPWRLLRAFLATWHLKASDDIDSRTMRRLVGKLATRSPRYQLPPATTSHTRHYMPDNAPLHKEKGNDAWGPGKDKIFDTFISVGADAPLRVCWDVELDPDEREALSLLLTRLSYLGRAESLVEAALATDSASSDFRANAVPIGIDDPLPSESEHIRVLTPLSESAFAEWRTKLEAGRTSVAEKKGSGKRGKSAKKASASPPLPEDLFTALHADTGELQAAGWLGVPPGAQLVSYARPENCFAVSGAGPLRGRERIRSRKTLPTVARYAIASNVLPRLTGALSVAERMHQALLSRFKDAPPPEVFSGRDADGQPLTGHAHAHIFCEPDDRRDTIAHLTVYARSGFDADAQRALRSVDRLWGHGGHDLELVLLDLGDTETFSDSDLFKSSKVWESLTPFVPTRHPKTYRDGRPKIGPSGWQIDSAEDEIRRTFERAQSSELQSRQLAAPVKIIRLAEGAANGRALRWHQFVTRRVHGGGVRAQQPARGFRLTFEKPTTGPLALGYAAHFGLGLFVPAGGGFTSGLMAG